MTNNELVGNCRVVLKCTGICLEGLKKRVRDLCECVGCRDWDSNVTPPVISSEKLHHVLTCCMTGWWGESLYRRESNRRTGNT